MATSVSLTATVSAAGHVPAPLLSNNLSGGAVAVLAADGAYVAAVDAAAAAALGLAHAPSLVLLPVPLDTHVVCHAVLQDEGLVVLGAGPDVALHALAPGNLICVGRHALPVGDARSHRHRDPVTFDPQPSGQPVAQTTGCRAHGAGHWRAVCRPAAGAETEHRQRRGWPGSRCWRWNGALRSLA
jgi:hypothetical protein